MGRGINRVKDFFGIGTPKPIMSKDLPKVKVDIRGLAKFCQVTGKDIDDMSDAELSCYVGDVEEIRKFFKNA